MLIKLKIKYHSRNFIPVAFCSSEFQGTFWYQFQNARIPPERESTGMAILAKPSANFHSSGSSLQSSMYSCRNPLESGRFRSILGIPWNGILAVLPAKIAISVPRNSSGFRNGHEITKTESTGTESPECFLIVIVIFKSNTNYLIVITINY